MLRPDQPPSSSGAASTGLPPDLVDQVRGRLRLLAALVFIATAIDPIIYADQQIAISAGANLGPIDPSNAAILWVSLVSASASMVTWFLARRVQPTARLFTLGLAYEAIVCLTSAAGTTWWSFHERGVFPNLTWAPAMVMFFPLVLPGPPRRMLVGAIIAGAMSPLALVALAAAGTVPWSPDDIAREIVQNGIAVVFAAMGARVVYRLGREVAEARELGAYRLEHRLGEGGMGEVWRARHRLLARPAAVKLIRQRAGASGIDDDARRRFEREAQVTATLRSQHTVTLFDFGVAADGTFYYVMELLDGLDADRLVRQFGPMPAARVVVLMRQVCHSLAEAHALGLVHRDIKPANIFLSPDHEGADVVKVLDFGLARAFTGDSGETGATAANIVQGTPSFIAPEQALGHADLDARVDIYAAGCVAYWMLTGHTVFDGKTPVAHLMHHVSTVPGPPSVRTELAVPADLDGLVLACLAKDPADRPQTARELADALAAIPLPQPWTDASARDWWTLTRAAGAS